MPYNVICFVCTVVAIGFGSIFNLTTRKLVPDTEENRSGIFARLKGLLKSKKEQEVPNKDDKDTGTEMNIDSQ